ncbi:transposase [Pseudophaeobacter sp. EL27]|uniref:transposase n=1 Tax=Pseudophaeobacter sp. EL27 TaxID=2107580 RepID=UPI00352BC219
MLKSRAAPRLEQANLSLVDDTDGHCSNGPLTYKSAADDPTRSRSSKHVGPWGGLILSQHQSGNRDATCGLTKVGDVKMLRALCQVATAMVHRGCPHWLWT